MFIFPLETFSSVLTSTDPDGTGLGGIAMLTLSDVEDNLHFIIMFKGLLKKSEKGKNIHCTVFALDSDISLYFIILYHNIILHSSILTWGNTYITIVIMGDFEVSNALPITIFTTQFCSWQLYYSISFTHCGFAFDYA